MTLLRLDKLSLTNYRCFKEFSIDFNENLTVIVAENGVGKTAILDAISIALGPFLGGFDSGIGKGFRHTDARLAIKRGLHIALENASRRMEAQYPIKLDAVGVINNQLMPWSRELTGKKTKTTFGKAKSLPDYAKNLQQLVRDGDEVTLPIVAYYGTGRLWKKAKVTRKRSAESNSRLFGYYDALNPDSNYGAFEKWFIDTNLAEYDAKLEKLQQLAKNAFLPNVINNIEQEISTNYSKELGHIREAINPCIAISGYQWLEYDPKWKELVVRTTSESNSLESYIPVVQLSDGVKAMLSLTADIAYRCVKLNPHLTKPTEETQGIVLIDEVDLHLHPKWQQTVLNDLSDIFPKIQFIVTTHSPQVLSTVHRDCIRLLGKNSNGQLIATKPVAESYGEMSGDVLEGIMLVNPMPPVPEKVDLDRLTALVDQGLYDEWETQNLLERLRGVFGNSHPHIQKLLRSIQRQKALRS